MSEDKNTIDGEIYTIYIKYKKSIDGILSLKKFINDIYDRYGK